MKIKNIYLCSLGILLVLGSCADLDQEVTTNLEEQQVYHSYDQQISYATSVYTALPTGFTRIDGAMLASASDEAEHTEETSNVHKFNVGSWGPIDNPDNIWGTMYNGIRRANNFLSTTDSIRWGGLILNPTPENQAMYEARLAEINRMAHEVRFLRAYYYFELVKRYGGVPILTEALSIDTDVSNIQRATLAQCIDFIVSECDSTAKVLPVTYVAAELGRATKGAALALKSRVLLYAASDLYNDPSWAGGYATPELISLTGDRKAKWQAAADAAKAVIDLGVYNLSSNYQNLFKTFNDPEIIFTRRASATNTFEKATYPIGYDLGRSGTTPTQDLVDAYEMANGKAIAEAGSGYDAQKPYVSRDPRLGMTVITNNSAFKGRPVEAFTGGKDGKGVALATRTGYYLKKYVDEGLNLLLNNTSVHSWHIFRLGEIYLNYAEALNEASPGHADIKIYVDKVRQRTGVKQPVLPTGLSQAEMRVRIRNERRIELAFEEHRMWDVRRWMQGPEYLNRPARGVEITQTSPGEFSYSVINVENRVFQNKMYFYPIPQAELNIMKNWVQNPLW